MRVGLIGCGRIAFEAHLPAYKKYNVKVIAVCDLIEERAKRASKEYNVSHYYLNAVELASCKDVDLIDIATPPNDRISLLRSLYKFNKPMLIQKPLSYDFEEAKVICKEFKKHNLKGAVNHNARWAPVSQKIKEFIDNGDLGKIYQIHHLNRFNENLKTWYTDEKGYMFLDHGLHYFDLIRFFVQQMPKEVSAMHIKMPDQIASCSLAYAINFKFTKNLLISMYFNNAVPIPAFVCNWFIDGNKASIYGTIDSVMCLGQKKEIFPMTKLEGEWVPEGFFGVYKHFVESIKINVEPTNSLFDHLKTLKIAHAAFNSALNFGEWVKI